MRRHAVYRQPDMPTVEHIAACMVAAQNVPAEAGITICHAVGRSIPHYTISFLWT